MAVRFKLLLAALPVLAGLCVLYAGALQAFGNFHTVIEGQLYRSAQPNAAQLTAYVRDHGIKTVINLRGPNPNAAWYQTEIATARALGVEHIDFRMLASSRLTPQRADEIAAIMAAAPKPILIHCQSGSDRSGLVAAIYSYRVAGEGERAAEGQLSFFYGHVGIPHLSPAWAMDASWEDLEEHVNAKAGEPRRASLSDGWSRAWPWAG